jgi:hypothetical protein
VGFFFALAIAFLECRDILLIAMKHQQILWAIDQAALVAAEYALDAFGRDPGSAFPAAEEAWDFLNEHIYLERGVKRPEALPDFLPAEFKYDYYSHLCSLARERSSLSA